MGCAPPAPVALLGRPPPHERRLRDVRSVKKSWESLAEALGVGRDDADGDAKAGTLVAAQLAALPIGDGERAKVRWMPDVLASRRSRVMRGLCLCPHATLVGARPAHTLIGTVCPARVL